MTRRGIKSTKWSGILDQNLDPESSYNDIQSRFNALYKIYSIDDKDEISALKKLVFYLANELKIQGFMYKSEYKPIVDEYEEYIIWKIISDFKKEYKSVEKSISNIYELIVNNPIDDFAAKISKYYPFCNIEEIRNLLEIFINKGDLNRQYYRFQRKNKFAQAEIKNENVNTHEIFSMYSTYLKLLQKEKDIKNTFFSRFCQWQILNLLFALYSAKTPALMWAKEELKCKNTKI